MLSPVTTCQVFFSRIATCAVAICLAAGVPSLAQSTAAPKSAVRKTASAGQHGLTQADVQKMWAVKNDTLLMNQIHLKGLAFEPEEDWLSNQLPKLTGVKLSDMPRSAAELKIHIQAGPEVDVVSAAAPALLDKVKEAAQKRSAADLEPLLHPELAKDKAKVYDLFDVANYRGHSLGRYAAEPNRQVSVQFFQLTTSQVERVHYVYFSMLRGKVVVRDVKSGPEEAERFLRDEEQLAQSKLQLMFRALNDGDEAGVKMLCTDGLYQSIKDWGGDKHPGDRLTRGRKLELVSVKTSVPLDQKSVRVVARISYPLSASKAVTFDADFERIGNDLKIVRVRDTDNKLIVFDPNMDNYLNRRYGLPDGPVPDPATVAMTEQDMFLSLAKLRNKAARVLDDHNTQAIKDVAQTFIDSDPSAGEGYGLRTGADELLGNYDDAEKDATRAIEHGGTAYFVVQRHGAWQTEPFTPVVLGVSKTKIEYRPSPGHGNAEEIDVSSIKAIKFDNGKSVFKGMLKGDRPFLSLTFKGNEGKSKTYNLAAFGTTCTAPQRDSSNSNLVPVSGGDVCGSESGPSDGRQIRIFDPNAKGLPLYVPRSWQQDLTAVLRTVEDVRKTSGR